MWRTKALRWALFLVIATSFFIALYSLSESPQLVLSLSGNHVHNLSTAGVTEIIGQLYEQNQTCHQYFSDYLNGSDNVAAQRRHSAALVLYQPPCPLADLPDFRFLLNRDVCADADVYMLVLVGSHPANRDVRDVLRRTLGAPAIPALAFKMAFLFGHVDNVTLQRQLEAEAKTQGDVIQGSFSDSYHNVTLRDLMGLRWAWEYCPQARLVMRMDDDVSVDVYALVDAVERHYPRLTTTIGCFQLLINTPVFRSGRYAVSKEDHPGDIYDPYCQGWMYILTPKMAYKLDLAALRNKPYWMNDAYITGTLLKALGEEPLDINVNYTISVSDMEGAKTRSPPAYTVGPVDRDAGLILALHQNYQKYALEQQLPKFNWTLAAKNRTWARK